MAKAIRARDIASHKERVYKTTEQRRQQDKTWEELSDNERFAIMKQLAVAAGLVKASS